MRVLFINSPTINYEKIIQKHYPPIGMLYLAKILLNRGDDVRVLDSVAMGLSVSRIMEEIEKFQPDLLGSSVFSENLEQIYKLIKKIRGKFSNLKIVLGGPGVYTDPQKVLSDFKNVDYVIFGEAENSILKLCEFLEGKISLSEVPQVCYYNDGGITCNDAYTPVRELDTLDFPARELVDYAYKKNKYYGLFSGARKVDGIITSRGCPYGCKFCHNIYKDYRAASPEKVVEEMCQLYSTGIRYIRILDDNFTLDRKRAIDIFNLIIKEKMDLRFELKSRVDSMDEELAKKAKKAGVYLIAYGAESANQKLLDEMGKKIKVEEIVKACNVTKKYGILCHTGWIIGYPGDTPESIEETVAFIIKLKPDTINLNILIPYPGTEVYEEAKANGTLIGDWSVYTDQIPWVKLPWIESQNALLKYAKRKFVQIYLRPYYFYKYGREFVKERNLPLLRYAVQVIFKYCREKV